MNRLAGLTLALTATLVALWGSLHLVARALPMPERLSMSDSDVVLYRDRSVAHVFLSADEKWRISRPLDQVDASYLEALIALEDRRFHRHGGVDLLAMARAAWTNARAGRRVSGASTITMQLARLLEPRPRTYRAKLTEAFRAFQLEQHLTKQEILEAYLRFLPFGRNIEGIEAASLSYFGHGAEALSPDEIAILLAVPQAPAARHPSPQNRRRLSRARDQILDRLTLLGVLDDPLPVDARLELDGLRPFPRDVPHASRDLRLRKARAPRDRASLRIETTLDRAVQMTAEQTLRKRRAQTLDVGIDNAAIVVVEHDTGAIRALVGNHALTDGPSSYLSSYHAPRSPGSLLKPFIFAGALDRGLALPQHLVLDVPFVRGDYVAENYSGTFSGLVRLDDALSQSLNIPFIALLEALGVETHLEQLRQMGASHLTGTIGHYGLSVAVGALAITPVEAAGFYATLARGGLHRPVHLVPADAVLSGHGPGTPIYSGGASWLTGQGLSKLERPDFSERHRTAATAGNFAWKTGTSTGNRDAWAAGYGARYTVVIWLGNLNHRPHPGLIGSEAAAPLLFDLLTSLEASRPVQTSARPEDVTLLQVCAHSGYLPAQACPERVEALGPRHSVASQPCPFHVAYDVDTTTNERLTPECRAGRSHRRQSFLVWPPEVLRWLTEQQRRASALPAYAEGCHPLPSPHGPRVATPPAGQVLAMRSSLPASRQQVALQADAHLVDYPLSWFVNGELIATVEAPRAVFWEPRIGDHRVTVVDRSGRTDHRRLQVVSR
jgi:penicillin-binding protein 1C